MTPSRFLFIAPVLLALAVPPVSAMDDAQQAAVDVVHAFNGAMSARDGERMLDQLVVEGVQFDLRPAHAGQGAHEMAEPLRARWARITPALFNGTRAFTRQATILDVRASADIATVWATVASRMELLKPGAPIDNAFTEVYLLVRTPSGWKIGAMVDDRGTDRLLGTGR